MDKAKRPYPKVTYTKAERQAAREKVWTTIRQEPQGAVWGLTIAVGRQHRAAVKGTAVRLSGPQGSRDFQAELAERIIRRLNSAGSPTAVDEIIEPYLRPG